MVYKFANKLGGLQTDISTSAIKMATFRWLLKSVYGDQKQTHGFCNL